MTLHALIRAVLAPYLDANDSMKRERLIVKGCDVPIAEKAVSNLALVLHELGTNSVKLGSYHWQKEACGSIALRRMAKFGLLGRSNVDHD
jgi:two-component sensor histidine kinase